MNCWLNSLQSEEATGYGANWDRKTFLVDIKSNLVIMTLLMMTLLMILMGIMFASNRNLLAGHHHQLTVLITSSETCLAYHLIVILVDFNKSLTHCEI